jgi:hypothetical protein
MQDDSTYIFFEPKNSKFFKAIAEYYSEKYVEGMKEIAKFLESNYGSYPNYGLIDTECDKFADKFAFPSRKLVEELCPNKSKTLLANNLAVITSEQRRQLIEAIDNNVSILQRKNEVRNSLLEKIKQRSVWIKKTEVINLDDGLTDQKYKELYLDSINNRKNSRPDVKNFFFVSAKTDSNYKWIKDRAKLEPFRKCTAVQKKLIP